MHVIFNFITLPLFIDWPEVLNKCRIFRLSQSNVYMLIKPSFFLKNVRKSRFASFIHKKMYIVNLYIVKICILLKCI